MAMVMPTKMVPAAILDSVKRARPLFQIAHHARRALGSRLGASYVGGLGSRAHYNDFMLASRDAADVENYRRGALQFVNVLGDALAESGRSWADVQACLEVGCGYGRIVRELRHELPPEAISVCDVIDEGARFTASEFGVRKVPVVEAMGPQFDGTFDLVYLLSVYSHLNRKMIEANLARVSELTRPGGVLVFTTHGKQSAEMAEQYEQYWLDKAKLNATLERDGFFYERYPYHYADYGLTWIVADEVKRIVAKAAPGLEFVAHHPLALDAHQDVFVYRKR